MPQAAIESPTTASTIDRFVLSAELVRGAEASWTGGCACTCFEAEASYVNCVTSCFEVE